MAHLKKLRKAELVRLLNESQAALIADEREGKRLLHDLQVHQIELELQNRELREAQQALEASRDRYSNLYDFAPVGYLTLDQYGVISEANLTAAALLVVEREALIGRTLRRFVAKEVWTTLTRHWREVCARQGENLAVEIRIDPRGGGRRHVRLESRAEVGGDGNAHCRTVMVDISERKRAESALAEREARYRAVVETAPDGFGMIDREGGILAVNDAYVRRSGYSREELLTMHMADLDANESREAVRDHVERVRRSGSDLFETRHRAKDGEIWPAEVSAAYWAEAGGHLLGFIRDVSGRKRAEAALRQSEERYRCLFTHSPDAILVDQEERITLVNEAGLRLFGARSAEELVGKSPYALFHPDCQAAIRGRLRRLRPRETAPPLEERIVRLDGGTVDVEVVAAPFPFDGHDTIHVILRDISGRKALEREIIEVSTAEQERIGREVHDGIGQQLTGIALLAGSIEHRLAAAGRDAETGALRELRGYLDAALAECRSLAHGLAPVEVGPEGLADALSTLVEHVQTASGIRCRFYLPDPVDLPDTLFAAHLYRIAQEALNNAVKHAHAHTIEVGLERTGQRIVLQVRDDGIGLAEAGEKRGGLGLRIMRYRAGVIGGSLLIGPAPGGGTQIRCSLPV